MKPLTVLERPEQACRAKFFRHPETAPNVPVVDRHGTPEAMNVAPEATLDQILPVVISNAT
jgi:hypothetical protein